MALRSFVSQCGWRSKRKSQGEFCQARALYVFAYSKPDACHARLNFGQGRSLGSFPKQRQVIEPTARQANTLAKANTSVRFLAPFTNPHCNTELEGNSCVINEMKLLIRNHQLVMLDVNRRSNFNRTSYFTVLLFWGQGFIANFVGLFYTIYPTNAVRACYSWGTKHLKQWLKPESVVGCVVTCNQAFRVHDRRQLRSQGPLLLGPHGPRREGQGRVGEDLGNEIESQAGCVEEIRGRFARESSSDTTLDKL